MKKGKRKTSWFVESIGGHTNEAAMADLAQECGATDDKIHRRKKDNKGIARNVVEVEYSFVARLEVNAQKFALVYRVYRQVDGETAMRSWPFTNKKKLSRAKAVARVAEVLRNATAR